MNADHNYEIDSNTYFSATIVKESLVQKSLSRVTDKRI